MTTARNILRRLLLLTVGGAILLVGCVRDDRSECRYPLPLRFVYTQNVEQTDLFDAEVPCLDLFLYDAASGRLVDRVTTEAASLDPNNGFEWMVPPGTYDVVAWGGVEQRYGFAVPETFAEAQLSIVRADDGETVAQRQEHLFHALAPCIRVTGDLMPEQVLDLHKNSNDVRVEVAGLSEAQRQQLRCTIRSANGDYAFDNTCLTDRPVTYLPASSVENGLAVFDHTVLELWNGDASWLHVEIPADASATSAAGAASATRAAATTLFDGSLSELLLQRPGTDLDLEDEFTVRLEAQAAPDGSLQVSIYVNDWHVVDMSGGLS